MNVGSLFSGIGGLDEGLRRAGWQHAFLCEGGGDPNGTKQERAQYAQGRYRRSVLAARFPGVPIYEDVQTLDFTAWPGGVGPRNGAVGAGSRGRPADGRGYELPSTGVDLLCGGFPCQDLSVAGRRAGLVGDRSGLFFEFARVAESLRPRWLLVENVPGLLSSQGGRDFGCVLGTLAELGYGLAWRILDSRYFGVPQRRRRVFIIGALADGDPRAAAERAGEVLAVGSRCPRHSQKGGEAGQDVAPTLGASVGGDRGWDANPDRTALIAAPLSHGSNPNSNMAGRRREDDFNLVTHALTSEGHDASEDGTGRGTPLVAYPISPDALSRRAGTAKTPSPDASGRMRLRDPGLGVGVDGEPAFTLSAASPGAVGVAASVRRLTPRECERLQGLPDDWTQLGGTPDSRRYAALGDAVTVPVAEWIGRRLLQPPPERTV